MKRLTSHSTEAGYGWFRSTKTVRPPRYFYARPRRNSQVNIEIINFGLGLLGSVLGIIITIKQLWPNRFVVKLHAKYAQMINMPGVPSQMIAVEIINLNDFPIYITEVAVNCHDEKRGVFLDPFRLNQEKTPLKLEPRQNITAYADMINNGSDNIKNISSRTSCGETVIKKQKLPTNF